MNNAMNSSASTTQKSSFYLTCFIAMIAGGIFSYALAPYYYWWLAILSPAILYSCVQHKSIKQATMIGFSYGFGLWFVGAFWLYTSIHVYGAISSSIAVLMVAIMAMVMALFSAGQLYIYQKINKPSTWLFSAVWVVCEWLKTWLFTGFPWLFVGYAFTEHYLDAYAPVFGVLGISFIAVFLATTVVEVFKRNFKPVIASTIFLVMAYVLNYIPMVEQKSEQVSVSLIQGNIDQKMKWDPEHFNQTLDKYLQLSANEWGRDLIVWPESAIANYQTVMQDFLSAVADVAKQKSSTWITGIIYEDVATQQSFNSVMALGENIGEYHKQRLVPFGEYIPLSGLLHWVLPEMQKDIAQGSFASAPAQQSPIKIKHHDLATAICYEVAYPDLTRLNAQQSNLLLTVSNDAWFVGTAGPWQHLQMVQMRAIENGRWFIRATNTGVTAIINAQGQIVHTAPQDIATVVRGDVPFMQGQTWYNRFGYYPILLWSFAIMVIAWWRARKNHNKK